MDLAGIDAALAAGARAVLLCNPHNPLGLVHSREDLAELARIVAQHGAHVVSDEIHAPLTHHGVEFTPVPLGLGRGAEPRRGGGVREQGVQPGGAEGGHVRGG
ncbi:aminotransferase class I/II-fold pyridoxal phosphate-dependent enzyme, partial [Pseudoclavibacter helvolus]|uniref:aminotransferase class I/II-fold pyridoxal phosphate-dependent enzyme n=1 Tax=Pseudoclavibacter helvolus TaxID=255205 RepID=UPI0030B80F5D